jgi:hypothetical protein
MLIRRAIENVRSQDWSALVSELIIVILGIFIAIQADSWWQAQNDQALEQQYLSRLNDDVNIDIAAIEYGIALAELRKELADILITAADDPDSVRDHPILFMSAVSQAAYTYTPSLNSDTFEELRATGKLVLLGDENLKAALFEYYRFDQSQRQFMSLQLMQEFRHFELTAGVLNNQQDRWVQDNYRVLRPGQIPEANESLDSIESIVSAAARLAKKPDAVDWLPEARNMQLDIISTNQNRLQRAKALLQLLETS